MADAKLLSRRFSSCVFAPVSKDVAPSSPIVASSDGSWNTTSFYLDSSGRSSFMLPLQVGCPTKEVVDLFVNSGCLRPAPANVKRDDEEAPLPSTSFIRFEMRSHLTNGVKAVTVEGIKILSCTVMGNSILFDTEVVVRASNSPLSLTRPNRPLPRIPKASDGAFGNGSMAMAKLELIAILDQKDQANAQIQSLPGLIALEMGGGNFPIPDIRNSRSNQTRLPPILIELSLTHALAVSVKNVSGSSHGSTLVSLTIMHSNTHPEPVTITNIALHPGHSRQDLSLLNDRSMPGGEYSVTDMSKYVQWGYAPRTEPDLPLTLQPHDAYATVIIIEAGDDLRSRMFVSPISVTAVVGNSDNDECNSEVGARPCVVVATDAQWMTGRVAVEPADAFRIDMSVQQSCCFVGAPLVISLRVLNLSTETRDLMLLMAKDDEKASQPRIGTVNTAVVSEVNGYTFGVWGLSGDDNGTSRHIRDHELLAVDAALLLGEVKGQHSVDAELRFVPLREGTLDVPNLKLYDKTEGKWYNCVHRLRIVAAAKKG